MAQRHAGTYRLPLLFIDEDARTRQHVCRTLGGRYEVHLASSGAHGLYLLRERPYGLVLTSLDLSGELHGLGIVQYVKALPGYARVPVIGLIPADFKDYRSCLRAKCLADCLIKPFPAGELCMAVERALAGTVRGSKGLRHDQRQLPHLP